MAAEKTGSNPSASSPESMNDAGANRPFSTGTVIAGKWILMELIGRGGMGEVYRAHQMNLKRDVAIKIVSRQLLDSLQDDPEEAERAFDRLRREVETMAQVRHPNVLQIYDYGEIPDVSVTPHHPLRYIVMEYVPGNTLRFTMSEEGFGQEEDLLKEWVKQYFFPVLDAVEAVHARDIIHRDLKPENVFMDGDTPKIADFGLARSVRMRAISNSWDIKGTMHYMAPEQFADFRKVGPAADIYALGKILCEAVEGKIPPTTVPLKQAALSSPERPFYRQIDIILRKATAENPNHRFQNINQLRQALRLALTAGDDLRHGRSDTKTRFFFSRWTFPVAAAALIAVAAMTAWHLLGDPGEPVEPKSAVPVQTTVQGEFGAQATEIRVGDGKAMALVGDKSDGNALFYMDREKVTNHDFAVFLNETRETLRVKEGVVHRGDEIWFYMGTGAEPYEQIYFEFDRFQLRDPAWADRPVVQVSFFGARAYATRYGKRLPTLTQWRQTAAWLGHPRQDSADGLHNTPEAAVPAPEGHTHMMAVQGGAGESSVPVSNDDRGLQISDPGVQVKEWAVDGSTTEATVVSWQDMLSQDKPKPRYRSEGFPDVGFRTVIPLSSGQL